MFGKVSLDAREIEREEKEKKVFNVKKKKKTKIGRKENSEMLKKDAKERKERWKEEGSIWNFKHDVVMFATNLRSVSAHVRL